MLDQPPMLHFSTTRPKRSRAASDTQSNQDDATGKPVDSRLLAGALEWLTSNAYTDALANMSVVFSSSSSGDESDDDFSPDDTTDLGQGSPCIALTEDKFEDERNALGKDIQSLILALAVHAETEPDEAIKAECGDKIRVLEAAYVALSLEQVEALAEIKKQNPGYANNRNPLLRLFDHTILGVSTATQDLTEKVEAFVAAAYKAR